MRIWHLTFIVAAAASIAGGQVYGPADRDQPGDEMIQKYLARETEKIHGSFLTGVESAEDWEKLRPGYKQ